MDYNNSNPNRSNPLEIPTESQNIPNRVKEFIPFLHPKHQTNTTIYCCILSVSDKP